MKEELINMFRQNNGYLSRKYIDNRTLYYHLLDLIRSGVVERVRRGVYYYNSDGGETMIDVSKVIPGGVLCLYSAWFYYELTVSIPQSYCIAIERSRKLVLPNYPPITLYYWKKEHHKLGISKQTIEGFDVDIYDIEKCVCDAVKYRTKVGIEVASEVIRNYLRRKDLNLSRLMQYAGQMRIKNVLKTYLEIGI